MAKAFCDAFARAIGFDDKDIHHLDLLKLRGDYPEEFITVRAQPSHLADDRNVIVREPRHTWGVGPRLDLDEYRNGPAPMTHEEA